MHDVHFGNAHQIPTDAGCSKISLCEEKIVFHPRSIDAILSFHIGRTPSEPPSREQ